MLDRSPTDANADANVNANTDRARALCFTDLPLPVRRRIYILAGLVRVCPISFNIEGADKSEYLADRQDWWFDIPAGWRCFYKNKRFLKNTINMSPDGFDCMCPPLPWALLLVSHAVHDEVSFILFSENMFRICRSDRDGLSALFALSPAALRSITSLSLRLNACSCVPEHQCPEQTQMYRKGCPKCHYNCKLGKDLPISVTRSDGQDVISEWKRAARYLASFITPYHIRLSVVCDTLDYETAKQITKPLLDLPPLAECAIRLGQAPDPALQMLCEDTVVRLTGHHHPDNPFRFLDLPEEIHRHILGYTDLVSPDVIEWISEYGVGAYNCCLKCTDALETCCCSVLHAAYSSKSCSCWVMPSAVFLVNRKVYEYATEVFFSKNTFKLYPGDSDHDPEPDSLHILRFLQAIPQHALKHLRSLRFSVAGIGYDTFGPGKQYGANWNLTIDFIFQNLNLPLLCIRIEDYGGRAAILADDMTGIVDSTKMEDLEWKMYQHLAEPLSKLSGLRDLYIHFTKVFDERFAKLRACREIVLEKRAMGDAYDSTARGKFAIRDRMMVAEEQADANPIFGPDGTQVWPFFKREPYVDEWDTFKY